MKRAARLWPRCRWAQGGGSLTDGGWVFLGRVSALLGGLAVQVTLAHLLPSPQLGRYYVWSSVVGVMAALATFGIGPVAMRHIALHQRAGAGAHAHGFALAALLWGALGGLAASAVFFVMATAFTRNSILPSLAAAGWIAALVASGLLADVLRGFRDIRAATIQTEILVGWLGLAGVLALSATVPPLTVAGVVCALAVGVLGATTFGAWALAWHLRGLPEAAAAPPARWWREQSGPIWLNTGLWLVFGQMDVWVLGVFRAPAEVAVYGVASRVAILLNQPEIMARAVLMPRIAALHAQGNLGALQRMVRGAATLSTALASAGALGLALGGGWALAAVFGEPYRACLPVVLILGGGYVLNAAAGLAATTLLMTGNQGAVLRGSLVGSSFTLALLLVLTPAFGAAGAATAMALGFVLQNALMLGFARRLLGIWTFLAVRPGEWRATWRAAPAAPAGPGVS